MKQMLGKRLIWHKLRHQQPLISFAATPDQIRQPLTPQAPDGSRFLLQPNIPVKAINETSKREPFDSARHLDQQTNSKGAGGTHEELAIVGPGEAVEALDGDPTAVVELALVDDVGSLQTVLGHDVVGREAARGCLQLVEAVLGEAGPRALLPVPVLCHKTITRMPHHHPPRKNIPLTHTSREREREYRDRRIQEQRA